MDAAEVVGRKPKGMKLDATPEFVPTGEEQAVNLEHILPESPEDNWSDFDTNAASAYFKRLGNIALLQAKKNVIVGNSKFSEKRIGLKDSAFMLTKEVAKHAVWGREQIIERQARLAELAVKTRPLMIP